VLSPVLTTKDGSLLGESYYDGLPSLLDAWSLISIERAGGKEAESSTGVGYFVSRNHEREVLLSTYERIRKDRERWVFEGLYFKWIIAE
jgi:hypothetical protein